MSLVPAAPSDEGGLTTCSALYNGDGTFVLCDREPAPPGVHEVRIDVAFTGICGTDLHILHGAMDQRIKVPAPIGHEMSGRIGAVGAGVSGWTVGDAVTVMPLAWCVARALRVTLGTATSVTT
jgi:threonine dehydrogenase-like Zn-dependent dehydrogenase